MALADALAALARSGTALRAGTVTAVAGAQVVVAISGGELTLSRLASYASPAVGDAVLILPSDIGWVVLGKVATS